MKVGIVGVTGYAGEELYRLLCNHGEAEITHIMSKTFAGQQIGEVYANYVCEDMVLEEIDVDALKGCDAVFTALPHGLSMEVVPRILDMGIKVIDLSGDFRYNDKEVYEANYNIPHTHAELLKSKVYGLPEVYRAEIAKTSLVANPGCYTTTSILALRPLLKAGIVKKDGIIIDAKSGVSGAGRTEKLPFAFCETQDNFKAYGVPKHRHTSEIEQELSVACDSEIKLGFTPHLLPVKRGILATIYANLTDGVGESDINRAYGVYENEPFTHVLTAGKLPELKQAVLSNNCIIGYTIDKRLSRLIIVSCTDNLIKGAAGQAVQNMNIMFGIKETQGLPRVATYL